MKRNLKRRKGWTGAIISGVLTFFLVISLPWARYQSSFPVVDYYPKSDSTPSNVILILMWICAVTCAVLAGMAFRARPEARFHITFWAGMVVLLAALWTTLHAIHEFYEVAATGISRAHYSNPLFIAYLCALSVILHLIALHHDLCLTLHSKELDQRIKPGEAHHGPYRATMPFSLGLQVLVLTMAYIVHPIMLLVLLVPAIAYWIITPVIILRHPEPTQLDVIMVRTGYAFYCLLALLIAALFAGIFRT